MLRIKKIKYICLKICNTNQIRQKLKIQLYKKCQIFVQRYQNETKFTLLSPLIKKETKSKNQTTLTWKNKKLDVKTDKFIIDFDLNPIG